MIGPRWIHRNVPKGLGITTKQTSACTRIFQSFVVFVWNSQHLRIFLKKNPSIHAPQTNQQQQHLEKNMPCTTKWPTFNPIPLQFSFEFFFRARLAQLWGKGKGSGKSSSMASKCQCQYLGFGSKRFNTTNDRLSFPPCFCAETWGLGLGVLLFFLRGGVLFWGAW